MVNTFKCMECSNLTLVRLIKIDVQRKCFSASRIQNFFSVNRKGSSLHLRLRVGLLCPSSLHHLFYQKNPSAFRRFPISSSDFRGPGNSCCCICLGAGRTAQMHHNLNDSRSLRCCCSLQYTNISAGVAGLSLKRTRRINATEGSAR